MLGVFHDSNNAFMRSFHVQHLQDNCFAALEAISNNAKNIVLSIIILLSNLKKFGGSMLVQASAFES